MEFLLINHPLDCPICDQGGECQLQDLAVGYGQQQPRAYRKRSAWCCSKELGPLVAAEEMSRCIQCTRCVRFGQEIAGVMELGMIGRGEHAEIVVLRRQGGRLRALGQHDRPLPGGRAHLEAVPLQRAHLGAVARASRSSPHDGLGSNLVVQVKQNKVMRVLPLENEAVNECWLSDKDRFSYEGAELRRTACTRPMVKKNGQWQRGRLGRGARTSLLRTCKWTRRRRAGRRRIRRSEELYLAGQAGRGRRFPPAPIDFSADGSAPGHSLARHAGRRAAAASTACWSSARSCARTIR